MKIAYVFIPMTHARLTGTMGKTPFDGEDLLGRVRMVLKLGEFIHECSFGERALEA